MDLIEFRRAFHRHFRLGLVAAVLVLAVGVVTVGRTDRSYSATSTVLLTPQVDRFELASSTLLRVILPNVLVLAESNNLRTEAAKSVDPSVVNAPISVDATFETDTSTLKIKVSSPDPAAATAWSAALARATVRRLKSNDLLSAQLLDVANGAVPDGRTLQLLGIAGSVGLALVAFVLVIFAAQRFQDVRDVAGALRKRGVRVLGVLSNKARSGANEEALAAIAILVTAREGPAPPRAVIVTSFDDTALVDYFVERLREATEAIPMVSGHMPVITSGPLLGQAALLRAIARDGGVCIIVVDQRTCSVDEVVVGLTTLHDLDVPCDGVVVVRGVGRLQRRRSARRGGEPSIATVAHS